MLHRTAALLPLLLVGCSRPQPSTVVLTVCDLSRDFTAYRGKLVAVRGVYYSGLRQTCPQTRISGPWPSVLNLAFTGETPQGEPPVAFATDEVTWDTLDRVERAVEYDAEHGKRVEIWVTALGQVRAGDHRSPVGPCDIVARGRYGHLGGAPAELVVKSFSDIAVVPNPNSPYDYSHVYRGAR
jgi:hypothetical protein